MSTNAVATVTVSARSSMGSTNDCVSNVVFGFVLVLVMLFSTMAGGLLVWWVGSRKTRRIEAQAEKVQQERDALRDKEIQVHATATQHYLGEVNHWRKEFERMQNENEAYRKALEGAGIPMPAYNLNRQSTMMSQTVVGSRPTTPDNKSRDVPSMASRFSKLNFEKEEA